MSEPWMVTKGRMLDQALSDDAQKKLILWLEENDILCHAYDDDGRQSYPVEHHKPQWSDEKKCSACRVLAWAQPEGQEGVRR